MTPEFTHHSFYLLESNTHSVKHRYAERKEKKRKLNNTTNFDERTKLEIEIDRLTMCLDFRNDVVVVQIVPALIAAFVTKLDTMLLRQEPNNDFFSQLENVGFLLAAESLLSKIDNLCLSLQLSLERLTILKHSYTW